MLQTCSTFTNSVTLSDAASEKRVVKINGQYAYYWDILQSQRILDVIEHIEGDSFDFQRDVAHRRIARGTQSNCRSRKFSTSYSRAVAHSTAQSWIRLITRFRESYSSVSAKCESTKLKKSSRDWLKSAVIGLQHLSAWTRCNIHVSMFCQVEQKHSMGWENKTCFSCNISAKII